MILSTCILSFLVASLLFGSIFWAFYCRLFSILRSYCYPCFGGLRSELCEFSEVLGDGSKCKFVAGAAWPCEPEAPEAAVIRPQALTDGVNVKNRSISRSM